MVLAWIGAILVLLFFWLSGHWFARLLMTLPLAFIAFLIITDRIPDSIPPTPAGLWIVGGISVAVGWLVASLPAYHQRQH